MNCIKCAREIPEDQVFCPSCMELMAQHPVKSDVVVVLPHRVSALPKKATPRKRARTAEEEVQRLKRRNRQLISLVSLLLVLSVLLAFLSVGSLRQLDMQKFLGQNYSTAETFH